jgi:hypothetical protein
MLLPCLQQSGDLNPEVETALRRLLASPEVSATFHDPNVHNALQEVRVDVRSITKYRNDPAVMQVRRDRQRQGHRNVGLQDRYAAG